MTWGPPCSVTPEGTLKSRVWEVLVLAPISAPPLQPERGQLASYPSLEESPAPGRGEGMTNNPTESHLLAGRLEM